MFGICLFFGTVKTWRRTYTLGIGLLGLSITIPIAVPGMPAVFTTTDYDCLVQLLSDDWQLYRKAFQCLETRKDRSLLPGLAEVHFLLTVRQSERLFEVGQLMERIAAEKIGYERTDWIEWIGRHEEIRPKDGYWDFKAFVLSRIDPAFLQFFQHPVNARIRPEEIVWGGVLKDGIPALDNPRMLSADQAGYLKESDRLFGVEINGDARAYPLRIMDWHEMCNDVVGGRPVSLSYCTLCGSGILYDGSYGPQSFTFGSSGLLYRSNKLMYDRQTLSLWNNLTGEPVMGSLGRSGIRLTMLPLRVTTWREWRETHPDTRVLDVKTKFQRDYNRSPYRDYFSSKQTMFPVWKHDRRLRPKTVVFALRLQGKAKAYPLEILKKERIIHDSLAGTSILIVTDPKHDSVCAYDVGARRFRPGKNAKELVEEGSANLWQVREDAVFHAASKTSLVRLPGHMAYWFGWYAFYPETELFQSQR